MTKTNRAADRKLWNSISAPMWQVLLNLANGRSAACHVRGQSAHGGFTATARALVARGLMTWEHKITEKGQALVAKARAKEAGRGA